MAVGYEGKLVRLVASCKERHLENALRWINDPEITETLLIGDFPISRSSEEKWFDSVNTGQSDVHFAIETLDGTHIGFSGIHGIDFRNGTATTGSFIGEKQWWGRGFGTDAANVRSRYCFHVLGLRILYSAYIAGNVASARMQQKAGYREYGIKPRASWKRGEFRDEVLTYLDRETWLGERQF